MTPERLHKRALSAINQGRHNDAIVYCDRLTQADPNVADAWFLKAMALVSLAQLQPAQSQLTRAIELEPNNSEYLAQGAKIALALENLPAAKSLALAALKQPSITPLSLDTAGVVLTKVGEFDPATSALRQAVKRAPNNAQFRFNLGSAEQFLGNAQEAETQYRQAIQLNPNFARAYWALSELHKISDSPQTVHYLKTAVKNPKTNITDNLYLAHALAREMEKSGDYSEAFTLLAKAKSAFRPALQYSIERDQRMFEAIKSCFQTLQPPSKDSNLGTNCLFIVGMPRTGTTLVDRIVNNHSQAVSLGELPNLAIAIKNNVAANTAPLSADFYQQVNSAQFHNIGQQYLASLADVAATNKVIIDKTPLNFLNIGFIQHALPAAKIIVIRRNPLDTCLSNFRQLFSLSSPYYHYNYAIEDIARYYCLFNDIIQFWQASHPSNTFEINYEQLVTQPQVNAQKTLEFCGLAWEEHCLNIHQSNAAVATASAMQVRQPINNQALNRWHHYKDNLAPATAIFEAAGISPQTTAAQ